jgi:hypothetical protein
MNKKLLLNLISGVLLISFCGMEKAVGAVSSPRKKGNVFAKGRNPMEELSPEAATEPSYGKRSAEKSGRSSRSRSVEPKQRVMRPLAQPQAPGEPCKVVPVICNECVLEVYRSPDCCSNSLWQAMLNLTEGIMEDQGWSGSQGIWELVNHLVRMYPAAKQKTKDAIALYFFVTAGSYAGGLAGDDDDIEQKTIDFTKRYIVNERKEPLFPQGK